MAKEMDICFESATVGGFDCDRCGGTGIDPVRVGIGDEPPHDPDTCSDCGGAGDEFVSLDCFLMNLAVAGGLCHAFRLGSIALGMSMTEPCDCAECLETVWRPGCQRPAP